MDPKIAADLAQIREILGEDATDDEAAALAIQTLADHLRNERIVMTGEDLQASMVRYAEYVVSVYAGEGMRIVMLPDGGVGLKATGKPVPDPPTAH